MLKGARQAPLPTPVMVQLPQWFLPPMVCRWQFESTSRHRKTGGLKPPTPSWCSTMAAGPTPLLATSCCVGASPVGNIMWWFTHLTCGDTGCQEGHGEMRRHPLNRCFTTSAQHRHNLRDRLGTPYLQSTGLNKVYNSDLMHNVSQLVCEKSSFWGEFGIIMAAKHGAMAVAAEFHAKECGAPTVIKTNQP